MFLFVQQRAAPLAESERNGSGDVHPAHGDRFQFAARVAGVAAMARPRAAVFLFCFLTAACEPRGAPADAGVSSSGAPDAGRLSSRVVVKTRGFPLPIAATTAIKQGDLVDLLGVDEDQAGRGSLLLQAVLVVEVEQHPDSTTLWLLVLPPEGKRVAGALARGAVRPMLRNPADESMVVGEGPNGVTLLEKIRTTVDRSCSAMVPSE